MVDSIQNCRDRGSNSNQFRYTSYKSDDREGRHESGGSSSSPFFQHNNQTTIRSYPSMVGVCYGWTSSRMDCNDS